MSRSPFNPDESWRGITSIAPPYGNSTLSRSARHRLNGLGDATATDTDSFDWSQVPSWLTQIQTIYNSQKLAEINFQRAAAGLPPLSASQYAPTVNLGIGMSPDTQKMLLYGAIGLGAFLLLKAKR